MHAHGLKEVRKFGLVVLDVAAAHHRDWMPGKPQSSRLHRQSALQLMRDLEAPLVAPDAWFPAETGLTGTNGGDVRALSY